MWRWWCRVKNIDVWLADTKFVAFRMCIIYGWRMFLKSYYTSNMCGVLNVSGFKFFIHREQVNLIRYLQHKNIEPDSVQYFLPFEMIETFLFFPYNECF